MLPNTLRIHDFNVRYGESPEDVLVKVAFVPTLDLTTNVVQTNVKPGTQVLVVPYAVATVAADGTVTLGANPEPAEAGPGGYFIYANGFDLQGGVID